MTLLAIVGPEVGLGRHLLFGAGGDTSIPPIVLGVLALGIALILFLPRKFVLAPLLVLSFFGSNGLQMMIGPLHFQIPRILLIFALGRMLWQRYVVEGAASRIKIVEVDKAVLALAIVSIICYTLLWQESAAFIYAVGKSYNLVGFYFVLRFFIRDRRDVERTIKILACIAIPIALLMLNEKLTGHNVLGIFGGVPEQTAMRNGYLRAQGPFSVYLTAGSFGATLFPLILCLWHRRRERVLVLLAGLAAFTIMLTSGTSTAIAACLASIVALSMWPIRNKMRTVRWGIVFILLIVQLAMKAPVWALLARVDIVGGSTGWQRYKIVDNFIRHFWDWWLLGSNNYWTWSGGDDMWDTANQYVAVGETNGLFSLIFFLATIVYCFQYIGKAIRASKRNRKESWFFWLLGVALFSNLVAFSGISYFDQTSIYWSAILAIIVSAASPQYCPALGHSKVTTVQPTFERWDARRSKEIPLVNRSPLRKV